MGWFGNNTKKDVEKLDERPNTPKKEEDKVITETKKDLERLKQDIKK